MRNFVKAAMLLMAISLSGCFTSEKPLIGADEAVFPYERITYVSESNETQVLVRTGDVYIDEVKAGETPHVRLRFKPAGEGFYLVQAGSAEDPAEKTFLYALLKVDLSASTVESYAAVAPDDVNAPGLVPCGRDGVCITDLGDYLRYARSVVASGAKPAMTFRLIALE